MKVIDSHGLWFKEPNLDLVMRSIICKSALDCSKFRACDQCPAHEHYADQEKRNRIFLDIVKMMQEKE